MEVAQQVFIQQLFPLHELAETKKFKPIPVLFIQKALVSSYYYTATKTMFGEILSIQPILTVILHVQQPQATEYTAKPPLCGEQHNAQKLFPLPPLDRTYKGKLWVGFGK